jgi:hypothetical protein
MENEMMLVAHSLLTHITFTAITRSMITAPQVYGEIMHPQSELKKDSYTPHI